jgi:hypothetical protein
MENIIWKEIPGYNKDYLVSSAGDVYSNKKRRQLKKVNHSIGYLRTSLTDKSGERKTPYIHVLVAMAFLGERKVGYEVNHKDGNKKNNDISNLEYLTRKDNLIDAKNRIGEWRVGGRGYVGEIGKIRRKEIIDMAMCYFECFNFNKIGL